MKYWMGSGHAGNTSYTRAASKEEAKAKICVYWGADEGGSLEEKMEQADFGEVGDFWLGVSPISKQHYERAYKEALRRGRGGESGTFGLLTPDHF